MVEVRDKKMNFRTTEERYLAIKSRSADLGMTISEYLDDLVERDLHYSSVNAIKDERELLLKVLSKVDQIHSEIKK